MGVITTPRGQRSWFCWTPQGGRFSHDQTWNSGDIFSPWLTALDTDNSLLERINTPGERAGTLQVSPDGLWGASGSHNSDRILLFDLSNNTLAASFKSGTYGRRGFFDRDLSFSKDRRFLIATADRPQALVIISLEQNSTPRQIPLSIRPQWMKIMSHT